jgi:hypothetical protein
MPAPIDLVLARLDKVKAVGPGKWMARTPTRDEKTPSLSVRELDDGRVLLHDFGGDSTADVLAAIGLTIRDLFPGEHQPRRGPSKTAIRHEHAVYQIGLSMQMQGCRLSAEDQARFEIAKQRLGVSQ